MRKVIKILLVILVLGLVIFFLLVGLPFLKMLGEYNKENRDYTLHTTPLKVEVIRDICEKFEIPADDPRCMPRATVYAPEFYDDIKAYIRSLPDEQANVVEVQRLLGKYEVDREPITKLQDGTEYYRIFYDLRGDLVYPIFVRFTGDGKIEEIMANASGS